MKIKKTNQPTNMPINVRSNVKSSIPITLHTRVYEPPHVRFVSVYPTTVFLGAIDVAPAVVGE